MHSVILEVSELAQTMDGMKRTIRPFLDISQAAAAEENFDRLLPMLLTETLSAADADAGILFLVDGERLIPVSAKVARATFSWRRSWPVRLMPRARIPGATARAELFELFLRSGVYREYADRFMKLDQIDRVDFDQYLGSARSCL